MTNICSLRFLKLLHELASFLLLAHRSIREWIRRHSDHQFEVMDLLVLLRISLSGKCTKRDELIGSLDQNPISLVPRDAIWIEPATLVIADDLNLESQEIDDGQPSV